MWPLAASHNLADHRLDTHKTRDLGGFISYNNIIWDTVNKEFCLLHVQSNTTIFYLLAQ